MKLPIGQIEKSKYKSGLQETLKKKKIIFIMMLLTIFISIGVMEKPFSDFTQPVNASSITSPVAFVYSDIATGSAFLTGSRTLLTARHVIEGVQIGDEVGIIFKKTDPEISTSARVVWIDNSNPLDEVTDFAVLKLIDASVLSEDMPYFTLGSSADIEIGDEVKAIGYPKGLFSVTEGKISNTLLQLPNNELDLIQLDCNVYPGNSGGPIILSETEEVIGIAELAMQEEFQGINFASKIDKFIELAESAGIDLYE
ncbi:MAG: hypothetical protein COA49_03300 [Bacteroidetes bacterium]|nr:MAG: hypothetical protein COA49_03300 [Bacteroidota bacterium]